VSNNSATFLCPSLIHRCYYNRFNQTRAREKKKKRRTWAAKKRGAAYLLVSCWKNQPLINSSREAGSVARMIFLKEQRGKNKVSVLFKSHSGRIQHMCEHLPCHLPMPMSTSPTQLGTQHLTLIRRRSWFVRIEFGICNKRREEEKRRGRKRIVRQMIYIVE